ncbi:MAG TPA: NAD(P)-dependent oxidoreductase [Gemmataceae bacterium]|nr:NAD(P)-dependent oxidoreductase [Gemmataceae bacterium]
MKIHLTGGKGFLARWLVPHLREVHEVEVSDRDSMDVTALDRVCDTLASSRPDMVIHFAALCGAKPSRDNPPEFFAVNAQGTVNVLEACRRAGVPRFLLASSLTVHGAGEEARMESSPFAPRHPYAVSKVAAEFAALNYCQNFGLSVTIVRPTLVVGENYKEPHAVGDFVATVLRGDNIVLFGDGHHRRDFVHPLDVARAVRLAAEHLGDAKPWEHEVFNIGSGELFRMVDLADLVIRVTGRGRRVHGPASEQSFSLYTRIDRAQRVLGYRPSVCTEDIIHRLIHHSNLDGAA